MLKDLERRGLVGLGYGAIRLLDVDGLRRVRDAWGPVGWLRPPDLARRHVVPPSSGT